MEKTNNLNSCPLPNECVHPNCKCAESKPVEETPEPLWKQFYNETKKGIWKVIPEKVTYSAEYVKWLEEKLSTTPEPKEK